MIKKIKTHKKKLDPEEKDILSSFKNNEFIQVENVEMEKKLASKAAAKSLRKDIRINIRLSSSDISNIKEMAAYEGLPYQTFISSVLHKYAAGHLTLQ